MVDPAPASLVDQPLVAQALAQAYLAPSGEGGRKVVDLDSICGALELTPQGFIVRANDFLLTMLGYGPLELFGKHHSLLCPTDVSSSAQYAAFWQALREGKPQCGEFPRLTRAGAIIWLKASYLPQLNGQGQLTEVLMFATDITASRERSAHLTSRLEALDTSHAMAEFSPEGTLVHANDIFLRTMGYSRHEALGMPHKALCEPEHADSQAYAEFWEELRMGASRSGEFKRRTAKGEEVWLRATYSPVLDANAAVVRVLAIASDVTAAKQRQADMAGKLRALDISQAVAEFSAEGVLLNANDNFLRLFGYSIDEVRGRHHQMLCLPEYARSEEYLQFWQRLNEGQFNAGEYKRRAKSGEAVWIQATYNPVYDASGRIAKVVKFATDMTQDKRKRSELRGLAEAISRGGAVVECDLSGTVLSATQRFADIFGYEADELVGQLDIVLYQQVDEGAQYYRVWDQLRAGHAQTTEMRGLTKDGREVYVQMVYTPVNGPSGQPERVLQFATDLTARHVLEEELRHAKERAEHAVRTKGFFLANMSHEIRTPLNSIIGFAELLQGENLPEASKRHLNLVRSSARSLLQLLNDILDTAKLENGSVELHESDFSLKPFCEEVAATFSAQARKKSLYLTYTQSPDVPEYLRADTTRLRQILVNLLSNAVKFTEAGGVELLAYVEGESLAFDIKDTGIGIAADKLEKIFEPFSQADGSVTRRFGGTGLGTTIVRQLAGAMGGVVWVKSEPDVGSTFKVRIPLKRGQAPAAEVKSSGKRLPRLRVLAADDVPENLELLRAAFERVGHELVTAEDGQGVIDALEKASFDVILMDVQMPGISGLEATRLIRSREREKGLAPTPILALTAGTADYETQAARDAGMDEVVPKPLDLQELGRVIARLVVPRLQAGLPQEAPALAPETMLTLRADSPAPEAVVDWSGGLKRWGSEAALCANIDKFVEAQRAAVGEMLNRDNFEGLGALMHRIRGGAATLGLSLVMKHAGELEASRGQSHEETCLALSALQESLNDVQQVLPRPERALPASAPVEDLSELKAEIDLLWAALDNGAIDEDAYEALQHQMAPADWAPVAELIESFDFPAAASALKKLLS